MSAESILNLCRNINHAQACTGNSVVSGSHHDTILSHVVNKKKKLSIHVNCKKIDSAPQKDQKHLTIQNTT